MRTFWCAGGSGGCARTAAARARVCGAAGEQSSGTAAAAAARIAGAGAGEKKCGTGRGTMWEEVWAAGGGGAGASAGRRVGPTGGSPGGEHGLQCGLTPWWFARAPADARLDRKSLCQAGKSYFGYYMEGRGTSRTKEPKEPDLLDTSTSTGKERKEKKSTTAYIRAVHNSDRPLVPVETGKAK